MKLTDNLLRVKTIVGLHYTVHTNRNDGPILLITTDHNVDLTIP